MTQHFPLALLTLAACFAAPLAQGQWVTQTLALQPGWNAVHLEVQPESEDSDSVFAALPIESVWGWNPRVSTVQFIQDPNELLPGQPDWLTHLPADHAARATRNLFSIQGGRSYLLKLKAGAPAMNWSLRGRPVIRRPNWVADSFNLVGFPVVSPGSPTFQNFFSGSTAHAGKPVYRLNASGQWELIPDPVSAVLASGRAYWIYCQGQSTFGGPLQVDLEQQDGLNYGRILTEQSVRIRNTSASPASYTVRQLVSQAPPSSASPVLAGAVPLSYYRVNTAQNLFGWVPFGEALQRTPVAPGREWVVRLEVVRTAMAGFVPPAVHNGVLYQSLLEVSDGAGFRQLIPVSAEGLTTHAPIPATPVPSLQDGAATPAHPRAGLWVGAASIDRVNQPSSIATPELPVATASPFQFRLIVHVDGSGKVRLLQKVLQMFKEGTLKPDPANPGLNTIDQPGRLVLVTDDSLIPRFSGSTLRDGQQVARRISSPAFGFKDPVLFAGVGEFGAGRFTCSVGIDHDHALNPFKHLYHPEHDNLDARFDAAVAEGTESFTVTRQVELEFSAADPDGLTLAGWGDNQLGGIYRETVLGLHKRTLRAQGAFRLTHASRIGVLNDGL